MNCSLLPQNENNALALGRLTQGPSHIFNSDQRAKKTKSGNAQSASSEDSAFLFCGLSAALRKAADISLRGSQVTG